MPDLRSHYDNLVSTGLYFHDNPLKTAVIMLFLAIGSLLLAIGLVSIAFGLTLCVMIDNNSRINE